MVLIGAPILDDAENVSSLCAYNNRDANVLGRWTSRNDGRDPESQEVGRVEGRCGKEGSGRVASSLSHVIQVWMLM